MAEVEPTGTVSHRALVSLKEAARIIGAQGSTIQEIRQSNQVKIGISPHEKGCSDRLLTCSGPIQNVADAFRDVLDVLIQDDSEPETHTYKPLNFILPPPSPAEMPETETTKRVGNLRLIVTNSQVSSIIGMQGARIKGLIERHGVKIVASKNFLPDSQDRVVEIQGFSESIASCLVEISQLLATEARGSHEKHYYPHTKNLEEGSVSKTVPIPAEYVGALLGRGGNRVANLRKYTKTKVLVSDESDENGLRSFTITGNNQNSVKLAETMLLKNLETEKQRRDETATKEL
ncbi:LAMI_0E09142g1_1 [Lachancea mirantina]|uniref:LAMI_0E09142g1_1 n=1 Tax=Lachancea mirantina TaxID=1230905 RepID=A0A1G4JND0_9SACH|nr:LAMI_0E09142g1_1 [Lachancea mirantina]